VKALVVFLDMVFVTRPVLWIPVWGFGLLGYGRSLAVRGWPGRVSWWRVVTVEHFAWMMVFSCSVGAVYAMNQLADEEVDGANPGFALLPHGGVGRKTAWWAVLLFGLASVVLPLADGRMLLGALAITAVALGAVYSFRPVRLGGRPVLDFASNAAGYGIIAFGAGWHLAGGGLGMPFWVSATPYVLLMCGGSISSTLPDVEGDRRSGKTTTAVLLGRAGAHRLAAVCVVAALAAALVTGDMVATVCAAAGLPFYVLYAFVRRDWVMEATYKVGGTAVMLAAAAFCPAFAVLALAVTLGTRVYFRRRFGVGYPSLLPASHAH
jgi:4-hydroxybenzoate polyprenyltransferase